MRRLRSALILGAAALAASGAAVWAQAPAPGTAVRVALLDVRRGRQASFERKRRDATRLADDFQKELEKKEQLLLQKVLQDLSGIIERVGKERGYHMIVERRGAGVLDGSLVPDGIVDLLSVRNPRSGPLGKK